MWAQGSREKRDVEPCKQPRVMLCVECGRKAVEGWGLELLCAHPRWDDRMSLSMRDSKVLQAEYYCPVCRECLACWPAIGGLGAGAAVRALQLGLMCR